MGGEGEGANSYLLFNLQAVDQRRQLGVDLERLLVVLQLSLHEVGQVPERLGSVQHVLHDADRLIGGGDELVLGRLDLDALGLGQVLVAGVLLSGGGADRREAEAAVLGARLGGVERQPRVLDVLARLLRERDVGVERSGEGRVEARDDLGVLLQPRFADLLRCERVLLERGRKRVAGLEKVRRFERCPAKRVAERLGRRLGAGLRQRGLGFSGGRGGGEQLDLLRDGAGEVKETLALRGWGGLVMRACASGRVGWKDDARDSGGSRKPGGMSVSRISSPHGAHRSRQTSLAYWELQNGRRQSGGGGSARGGDRGWREAHVTESSCWCTCLSASTRLSYSR